MYVCGRATNHTYIMEKEETCSLSPLEKAWQRRRKEAGNRHMKEEAIYPLMPCRSGKGKLKPLCVSFFGISALHLLYLYLFGEKEKMKRKENEERRMKKKEKKGKKSDDMST